jgi:hypothetical protein
MVANPVFLREFPFSGLLCVAPYCIPGDVRVVSNLCAEQTRPQEIP